MSTHLIGQTTRPADDVEAADAIRRRRAGRAAIGEPIDDADVIEETVEIIETTVLVEDVNGRANHVSTTSRPLVYGRRRTPRDKENDDE